MKQGKNMNVIIYIYKIEDFLLSSKVNLLSELSIRNSIHIQHISITFTTFPHLPKPSKYNIYNIKELTAIEW